MHIYMDVGKCLACSTLSLLGNFAVISLVECVLKFAMVKTVIPCIALYRTIVYNCLQGSTIGCSLRVTRAGVAG